VSTSPMIGFATSNPISYETPDEKLTELVRLQKFAQRITSTLELDELVPRIVDEVATSLGCVEINIFIRDPERSDLVLAGVHGCTVHGKGHRISLGMGMEGHVAATREMHYAPDVKADPYYMLAKKTRAPRLRFPCTEMGNWWASSRPRIARSMLSVRINFAYYKVYARISRSRFITHNVFAMSDNNARSSRKRLKKLAPFSRRSCRAVLL
jgi:hypothetical protein